LYSQIFAAHIWKAGFAKQPLCSNAGGKLRHDLLAHGGARPPQILLDGFGVGDSTIPEAIQQLLD
jgi:Zn-dependent oligopeptidase